MLSSPPLSPAESPLELPAVRVGSAGDAKALRLQLQQVLAGLGQAGERLELLLDVARAKAIHCMLQGPDGRYFDSWEAFLCAPQPWGLGISVAVVDELVAERRDPARLARRLLAAGGPSRLHRRGYNGDDRRAGEPAPPPGGFHGTAYYLERLKRDAPHLLQAVAEGTVPTVKAAARMAGFNGPRLSCVATPMAVARTIVATFPPSEVTEIVRLVQHPGEITDPSFRSPAWMAYVAAHGTPEQRAREATAKAARHAGRRERNATRSRERRAVVRSAMRAAATASAKQESAA